MACEGCNAFKVIEKLKEIVGVAGSIAVAQMVEAAQGPVMVRIPGKNYEIGKYEVTQAEWRAVMGSNPSKHINCDKCPVEQVSWNDIQTFIQKLNANTRKLYRLPTESEWEYACYAGSQTEYCGGN